jgi:ribosome-binding factor A
MTTRRQKRVAELLHEELSLLIQQRASDPRLAFVTVTGAEITPNLRRADVYVSILGDDETRQAALAALTNAIGFFRHELAAALDLRFVPELTFHLDVSLDRAERIDDLLAHLHEDE